MASLETFIFQCRDIFQDDHEEVFRVKNRPMPSNHVDFHGLFVDEAKEVFLRRLETAQNVNENLLKFITGKGIHSPGGIPKIRTAIEDLCDDLNLTHYRHPNDGIVVVNLTNDSTPVKKSGELIGKKMTRRKKRAQRSSEAAGKIECGNRPVEESEGKIECENIRSLVGTVQVLESERLLFGGQTKSPNKGPGLFFWMLFVVIVYQFL